LYSPQAVTDVGGAVVERYTYTAYGRQTVTSGGGAVLTRSTVGMAKGYTGQAVDAETGMMYFRARMYSLGLGRFVSRDPGVEINIGTNRPESVILQGRKLNGAIASQSKRSFNPYAGVGYQDGMNLYSAYFTPNGLDPFGLRIIHTETIACGIVTVETADPVGDYAQQVGSGTGMYFHFNKDLRGAGCCCKNFGWVQHGGLDGGGFRWDNGAAGGRFGGPSNPDLQLQPVGTGPGVNNPWYGGPSGPDGSIRPSDGGPWDDDWRFHPRPQNSIWDRPEAGGPYIAQLLCSDSGAVLFSWAYGPGNTGHRRATP
jgi:RHS repeat-associated protein